MTEEGKERPSQLPGRVKINHGGDRPKDGGSRPAGFSVKHAEFCCVRRLGPIDSAATRALVHVKEPIAPLSRASCIHLISSSTKRSFTRQQHFSVHAPCHTVRTRTILALLVPLFFLTHSIDDA